MTKRVLFVCTANVDRSPTAEALLKGKEGFDVLSAGTALNPESENKIIMLGITDIYLRNDPELIKILKTKLTKYLNIKW